MLAAEVGAVVVLDGDQIAGILSERDVVRAVAQQADLGRLTAGQLASRSVETATLDEDTADVARRMLETGIRHLPVQRGSTLVGMISMRDVLAVESWM
jgi:CBS domain-containing protein